jgi:hypothetical protein
MSRPDSAGTTAANTSGLAVLYRVDADAVIRLSVDDERALNALFASIQQRLGPNVRVSCWPYRQGRHWCVALDLQGDSGEVNITLLAGDEPCLPGLRDCELPLHVDDWRVSDGIDAFYVVSALLAALEAAPSACDWPFLGLKRIAR